MDYMKILLLITLLSLFKACGSDSSPPNRGTDQLMPGESRTLLEGKLQVVSGKSINLAEMPVQSTVLVFASDTCSVCRAEAIAMRNLFLEEGGLPTNINLFTSVIGGFEEDARDWKEALEISWDVTFEEGDKVFRKLCPELQTPCVVIANPETEKIKRFIGPSSISQWKEESGKWEF